MTSAAYKAAGIPWTINAILEATRGRLLLGNDRQTFSGISTDSRAVDKNDLFVAIMGETHDGHQFIPDIIRRGGKGFVICEKQCDLQHRCAGRIDEVFPENRANNAISVIGVTDTIRALGDMARYQRLRTDIHVIGVTGSNGKTTTREMTAAVLQQHFNTLATAGNFNNHIGMPLTLLNVTPEHEWAILELGMNHPGEIKTLGEICLPDIGIITNVAAAHIEGLGSIEGVAIAKGELLDTIRPGGKAILNGDDPHVRELASRPLLKERLKRIIHFGFDENNDIRAHALRCEQNGTAFTLALPEEQIRIQLKIPGTFMVLNALAAAGAGYICGLSTEEIKNGLEQFTGISGRMHVIETARLVHIIDDTYNANPGSMQAAINTLTDLKKHRNGFLVVGDMYELGAESAKQHAHIGKLAAMTKLSGIFATGQCADNVAEGARNGGLSSKRIFTGSKNDITAQLIKCLKPDDWVLIKGSRAMAMETMVQNLVHHYN